SREARRARGTPGLAGSAPRHPYAGPEQRQARGGRAVRRRGDPRRGAARRRHADALGVGRRPRVRSGRGAGRTRARDASLAPGCPLGAGCRAPGCAWRRRRQGHHVAAGPRGGRRALMSGRLRAYVVDDEPGALKQVVQSLKTTGRVDVVGTATSAETALIEIPARGVEALFLDIHMPGMTGFELLQRLTASPLVVFVPAFDDYALQAFEAA